MRIMFSYAMQAYVLAEQGKLLELVDPQLGSNYSKEEALQMLNLCLACTNPSPTLRPLMSIVVSILEGNSTVQVPSMKPASLEVEDSRLRSFGKLSYDSQTQSMATDWPWTGSSTSVQSIKEEQDSTSMVLLDHTEESTT